MCPGGRARGVEHGVDHPRELLPRLEGAVRADVLGEGLLLLAAALTHTIMPAARPSWISAVATPPDAPWTSILCPATSPDFVNSSR